VVPGISIAKTSYAVAVRDGGDLFVLITIVRDPKGDVYVNSPRPDPNWKPHASYHASGQHHAKSFNHQSFVRCRQRPDQNFRGIVAVEHLVIGPSDHRAINGHANRQIFTMYSKLHSATYQKPEGCVWTLLSLGKPPSCPSLGQKWSGTGRSRIVPRGSWSRFGP
jgi:hypothetical protein